MGKGKEKMKLEISDKLFDKESLENTPNRFKRFLEEWDGNKDFKFTMFDNPNCDQMVILKDIDFYSLCTHHILPFYGKVHIGYIPDKKICGISKLARVVDKFASKPQLQEKMTQEIVDYIEKELRPQGIICVVEGIHLCMRMRGIKKQNSTMVTSAIKGIFRNPPKGLNPREEFLRLIGK